MLGKLMFSLLIAASLGVATARLPVTPCILANTPDTRACEPGSCANKTCCETSSQRTSAPSHSLVKSVSQDISTAPPLASGGALPSQSVTVLRPLDSAPHPLLPPSLRLLLCTFLI